MYFFSVREVVTRHRCIRPCIQCCKGNSM